MSNIRQLTHGNKRIPAHIRQAMEWLSKSGYRVTDDSYCWVPLREIREIRARACSQTDPVLTNTEWGIAVCLEFPEVERVQRRMPDGVRRRGYAGLSGPGQLQSCDAAEAYTKVKWRDAPRFGITKE